MDGNKNTNTSVKPNKGKDIEALIKKDLKYFLISFIFVAGLTMWMIFKTESKYKNRSKVCLFGSFIGIIITFFIALVGGVMRYV